MSHLFVASASFWSTLFDLDHYCAEEVREAGCQHCGGVLHAASYPRKPRGVSRQLLGERYERRFSFCCARCRVRTTPPSVRFLGRKVYLAALVVLLSARSTGRAERYRRALIASLGIAPQTLHRWRQWWITQVPASPCWRALAGLFSPPITFHLLPGSVLDALHGESLEVRLVRCLMLFSPLTSDSCAHKLRDASRTQKQ